MRMSFRNWRGRRGGCSVLSAQELDAFQFKLESVCDRKMASQRFLQATVDQDTHIFETIESICAHNAKARCLQHGACQVATGPDLIVAGFPCALTPTNVLEGTKPGSPRGKCVSSTLKEQNSFCRFWHSSSQKKDVGFEIGDLSPFPSPWQEHRDTASMWSLVRWIGSHRPVSGVLENVAGFLQAGEGEMTPMAVLKNQLRDLGYCADYVSLNLRDWHASTRDRSLTGISDCWGKHRDPVCRGLSVSSLLCL